MSMRRILYETFQHIGVPHTLNEELTAEDKEKFPVDSGAYTTVRVGTARIVIGMKDEGEQDDHIVGVLNDDGTFVEGEEGEVYQ